MITNSPPQPQPPVKKSALGAFFAKFTVLRSAVPELWVVFGAKLLTIMAYQVMNLTLVLWLSSDLGFSDKSAGFVVLGWSTLMTIFTVLVGSFVDAVGLRKAFLLGVTICFVSRGLLTFTTAPWFLAVGLVPLALGESLLTPVMVAAIRRYTTVQQRSIAFAIFFALMNMGFGFAAMLFDYLRSGMGEHGHFVLPLVGFEFSTYRILFLASFLLTLPNLALLYFGIRGNIEVVDGGERQVSAQRPAAGVGLAGSFARKCRETVCETARIFGGLWLQPTFAKFMGFLCLMVALRFIYYQMYYTYPKFGVRELGLGAPVGRLWSINSFSLVVLVPIVGALTQRIAAFRMILIGSIVSASSVFIMALPQIWFQPLADGVIGDALRWCLGLQGPVHPYYVMILIFVSLLTAGEALWNPRLYEYTAAIAPQGQEASYMSLSYLPYFLAKLVVGGFSGVLLERYCPETGPRNSQTLWLVIALMTVITPVGLLLFGRFVRVHEAGRSAS